MENSAANSRLQLQLRKNQSDLAAIGLGVIAYGVWSVIKTVLYTARDRGSVLAPIEGDKTQLLIFWAALGVMLAVELALRLYVGRCAIVEGRGRKSRKAYIVLALLMAISSFAMLALLVYAQVRLNVYTGIENEVVAVIVELTSDVLLAELAIAALRVKHLRKKQRGAGD